MFLSPMVGSFATGAAANPIVATNRRSFRCSTVSRETARIAHAVNCVVRTDTGWFGHNTDGLGFLESARQVIDLTGLEVLVVGSGGAAHAIAIEVVGIDCREHPPLDGVRPDTSVMRIVLDGALALA